MLSQESIISACKIMFDTYGSDFVDIRIVGKKNETGRIKNTHIIELPILTKNSYEVRETNKLA